MITATHNTYWAPGGVPIVLLFERLTLWDWLGLVSALLYLVLLFVGTGADR